MAAKCAPRKMGLVVAMDLDGGIAKNGSIPWRLRKDMDFFKNITTTTIDKSKVCFLLIFFAIGLLTEKCCNNGEKVLGKHSRKV